MKSLLPFSLKSYLSVLFVLICFANTNAQTLAFPGAEGWGKYTTGGRGGEVYEVTTLADDGPGSLRDAVSQSGRIVVFRVSGTIELKSILRVSSNITIAGQTAPGDGICVKDYPGTIAGDNVIMRYVRFRLGDRYSLASDAFSWKEHSDIIIDHCSFTWGVDECFSAYGNTNMTLQYCIVGEGLDLKDHSMGGLWGGGTSYHHNFITTNDTRNPKYAYTVDGDITDSRNNIVYNWGYNSAYTSTQGRVNLVNNYYKAGPATSSDVMYRLVQAEPTKRMYVEGNYVYGYADVTDSNWLGVDPLNGGLPIYHDEAFEVDYPIPEQSALDAYDEIVQHVGASFPCRDDADARMIKNLLDGTGSIITYPDDVGGYPDLFTYDTLVDSDHDGMPDDYETGQGLDPNDYSDCKGDLNGDGYTNIENYINGIISYERQYPKPGFVNAKTYAEDTIKLSWYDLSDNELGFIVERSTDSATYEVIDTAGADANIFADAGLSPLTTYYYRVKSYCDTAKSTYSYSCGAKTFAAGALPTKAEAVSPANNSVDVEKTGTALEWGQGDYTLSFNVYLGTSESSLDLVKNTTSTSYEISSLAFATDYFWRIDAVNSLGITEGDVMKFSTITEAAPKLIGYWPFNETEGTVVYDSSENGNDGLAYNIDDLVHIEGKYNGGLSTVNFNTNSYIGIPHSADMAFGEDPFSISLWMRADTMGSQNIYLFSKGSHSDDGGENDGHWIGLESNSGTFRFTIDDNDEKTECSSTTSLFSTGNWTHIVIVRNTYEGKIRMFKDGVLITSETDVTSDVTSTLPLMLANSDYMNTTYWGEIDELVICGHAFSAGEIDSLYRFNKIPTLSNTTSIDEGAYIPVTELSAYPNPTTGKVTIEFINGTQNHVFVEIYNSTGQLVSNMKRSVIPNTDNKLVWDGNAANGASVENGLYLVVIRDKNGIATANTRILKMD